MFQAEKHHSSRSADIMCDYDWLVGKSIAQTAPQEHSAVLWGQPGSGQHVLRHRADEGRGSVLGTAAPPGDDAVGAFGKESRPRHSLGHQLSAHKVQQDLEQDKHNMSILFADSDGVCHMYIWLYPFHWAWAPLLAGMHKSRVK